MGNTVARNVSKGTTCILCFVCCYPRRAHNPAMPLWFYIQGKSCVNVTFFLLDEVYTLPFTSEQGIRQLLSTTYLVVYIILFHGYCKF